MQTVTLLQLRTAVRQRCNMENSQFVSDSGLTSYINHSLAELYELIVQSYEDYYVKELDFSYSTSQLTTDTGYTLPTDFDKLKGVDFKGGAGEWCAINPFTFINRNTRASSFVFSGRSFFPDRQYRLCDNSIQIIPLGQSNGDYRMFYIPLFIPLSNDSDSTSMTFSGWDEYVTVDASIKCLQKEESDVSVLEMQKQALIARISSVALGRDAGQPKQVQMVRNRTDGWW